MSLKPRSSETMKRMCGGPEDQPWGHAIAEHAPIKYQVYEERKTQHQIAGVLRALDTDVQGSESTKSRGPKGHLANACGRRRAHSALFSLFQASAPMACCALRSAPRCEQHAGGSPQGLQHGPEWAHIMFGSYRDPLASAAAAATLAAAAAAAHMCRRRCSR